MVLLLQPFFVLLSPGEAGVLSRSRAAWRRDLVSPGEPARILVLRQGGGPERPSAAAGSGAQRFSCTFSHSYQRHRLHPRTTSDDDPAQRMINKGQILFFLFKVLWKSVFRAIPFRKPWGLHPKVNSSLSTVYFSELSSTRSSWLLLRLL